MFLGRYKLLSRYKQILFSFILMILLCGLIQIGSITFISEASGTREYEVTINQGTIPIPKNDYKFVDIHFTEGKKMEVVYVIQVKDNLPINIYFVDEDNYLLLSQNAQFYSLIDGTGEELSYAKRIVSLTKHDAYKIVMTNLYINQSLEVDINYELRTYGLESDDSAEYPAAMIFSLITVIAVIGVLLVVLFILFRKIKEAELVKSIKPSTGKSRKNKHGKGNTKEKASRKKGKQRKAVESEPEEREQPPKKKVKKIKAEKKDLSVSENGATSNFCGYCGAPTDTPFCKQCGKKN